MPEIAGNIYNLLFFNHLHLYKPERIAGNYRQFAFYSSFILSDVVDYSYRQIIEDSVKIVKAFKKHIINKYHVCMKKKLIYEQVKEMENFSSFSAEAICDIVGTLIDGGFDRNDIAGIEKGIRIGESQTTNDYPNFWRAALHYYIANGWSSVQRLKYPTAPEILFDLESEEIGKEIMYLRKALLIAEKAKDNQYLLAQILTNLGNAMNHVGRFVEAVYYWNRAISILPGFGMAVGNLGFGLAHYARVLYDERQRFIFCKFSYQYLLQGIASREVYPQAKKSFMETAKILVERYRHDNLVADMDLNNYSIGSSTPEKMYREWCIHNSLFLNPLNDFVHAKIVSNDSFFLPDITASFDQPPLYHTIYNQLKQEYASARFLLYEGMHDNKPHFSDKGNFQVDTLDYAIYSLNAEKIKIAFRMCYSIFDKIAYILNDYLEVGLAPSEVSFRKVWYQKGNKKPQQLNQRLKDSQNWALRGLYWLSKDLTTSEEEFSSAILPESSQLVAMRNFIEHKSFMIVDMGNIEKVHNELTFQVTRHEMIDKTLVLMRMSRAAMMYLSFAIQIEEIKTEKNKTMPVYMQEILQRFKR